MPLGRKHLRRNRDAPNLGWTIQRTASNLSRTRPEVNVFFFQAEDGIRDIGVTGVQTCALPICGGEIRTILHEACARAFAGRSEEEKIGRASCRERVEIWAVEVSAKKKNYIN